MLSVIRILVMGVIMWPFSAAAQDADRPKDVYGFSFTTLRGEQPMPMSDYRGKVILLVNTASNCGFTPQYDGLEKLYEAYKNKGLVILGVPSNDFGAQEPGSGSEIASFCKLNYGVTFPMTSKQDVVGEAAHPLYKYARQKLGIFSIPKWNFHKYLINREGVMVDYFHSTTSPDDPRLVKAIETYLSQPPAP